MHDHRYRSEPTSCFGVCSAPRSVAQTFSHGRVGPFSITCFHSLRRLGVTGCRSAHSASQPDDHHSPLHPCPREWSSTQRDWSPRRWRPKHQDNFLHTSFLQRHYGRCIRICRGYFAGKGLFITFFAHLIVPFVRCCYWLCERRSLDRLLFPIERPRALVIDPVFEFVIVAGDEVVDRVDDDQSHTGYGIESIPCGEVIDDSSPIHVESKGVG